MRELADLLGYVNLALYTAVALVALWQWRQGRGRAALWAALAFGSIALVVDVGSIVDAAVDGGAFQGVVTRLIIAALALFPYFLYRFTIAFRPPTRSLERLLALMTVAVVGWTFLLPDIPEEGEPRTALFTAFVAAFTVHWTVLTIVVAWRLWRAGQGQPGVARRRMRTLAFASLAITVALIVSANSPDNDAAGVVSQALSFFAASSFLLALAPPTALRFLWRRAETAKVQETVGQLMMLTSEREIVERVLPPMAGLVGASSVTLCAPDGSVLGTYGREDGERLEVPLPAGHTVVVRTTSYAPYFGGDELATLHTVGALTELALDRSRLFAQEREARLVLERADELKTNFIALAAHELRNPVTVVHGIVETLERLDESLDERQRAELRGALRDQTARLSALVEQLLDLSRLDAEAIAIAPERLRIRERVDAIVSSAAAGRRSDVRLDVPDDLEANVDPEVLERVLSNLVVNALRYGEAPVTVRAEQRDRHFRLTVEDSGTGVPPDFVPDLFERFTRSRGAGAGGTGLGLAIARSYARAHRGDLLYERSRTAGASFQLVIPASGVDS
jgi:signal transduction histidine kinase